MEKKGEWRPCTSARNRLAFANGSDVRVGTNLRGGTMQFLHVSELAHGFRARPVACQGNPHGGDQYGAPRRLYPEGEHP